MARKQRRGRPVLDQELMAIAQRRVEVTKLYLEGWTQTKISLHMKVTQQTVSNDLKAVIEDWKKRSLRDFKERQAEELAKIDQLEAVAYEAWQRSCLPQQSSSTRNEDVYRTPPPAQQNGRRGSNSPRRVPARVTREEHSKDRVGDPRFLERIAWCIETRMKLLGMFKETSGNRVNQVFINWGDLFISQSGSDTLPEGSGSGELQGGGYLEHDAIEQRIKEVQALGLPDHSSDTDFKEIIDVEAETPAVMATQATAGDEEE